jgi:hypothetical protein
MIDSNLALTADAKQRHFCTLFNENYLVKGLVTIQSLLRYCPGAEIFVLCLDAKTQRLIETFALTGVHCVPLADVEDEQLLAVKGSRTVPEYCWTLTGSFCWWVLGHHPEINFLTYVDADLFFCSDVEPIFDEIGSSSVAIVEHRFTPRLQHLEVYGRFNVEWVSFRRDEQGMACLNKWREQCIEWCYANPVDGKLGDQKYLDAWPEEFQGVCIIQHKGAGLAPWNYSNYSLAVDNDAINVDDVPLIFYHFHQLQILAGGKFNRISEIYTKDAPPFDPLYARYEAELTRCIADIRKRDPEFSAGIRSASLMSFRRSLQRLLPVQIRSALRKIGFHFW